MKYQFTPEMDEISGMGGGYEETCRKMLSAGLEWIDAHPDADPKFHGYKNVYGIIEEDEDAKALSDAVVAGSGGDCTWAMHQTVVSHCLHIKASGWDTYVKEMCERREAG